MEHAHVHRHDHSKHGHQHGGGSDAASGGYDTVPPDFSGTVYT